MKEDIRKHCKTCATCMLHKLENMKFERKVFKPSLQTMDFICMDLIGEFHPSTSRGHHYALTAVCMLTGFTWCIPLKTKTAEERFLKHIYTTFTAALEEVSRSGQIMERSSRINSSRNSLRNWAQNFLSTHHHTGHKAMGR